MRPARPLRARRLLALAAALLLPACGDGYGLLTPGDDPRGQLRSGTYLCRAWSDFGGPRPAWEGYLELEVVAGGEIRGSYLLPEQCTDAFGIPGDCFGQVGGRVYRDGLVRFGFDEGWIGNEGALRSRSRVSGNWDTRILGYSDSGTFELAPYWSWSGKPLSRAKVRPPSCRD